MTARELEEKLRAQCHSLPGARLFPSLDERHGSRRIPDANQKDRVRVVDVRIVRKQRVRDPVLAARSGRITDSGEDRGCGGMPAIRFRMIAQQGEHL